MNDEPTEEKHKGHRPDFMIETQRVPTLNAYCKEK
jgi:hypothetical protein